MGFDRLDQKGQDMLLHGSLHQGLVTVRRDGHSGHDARLVNLLECFQAVEVRQVNIEDDDVRLQLKHGAHHVGSGSCFPDNFVAALVLDGVLEEHANAVVVLNQHNF